MGIGALASAPEDAQVVGQMKQVIHNTFPVPTPAFDEQVRESFDQLYGSFDNIMVTGRFGGKHWFLRDTIRQTYEEIGTRFH